MTGRDRTGGPGMGSSSCPATETLLRNEAGPVRAMRGADNKRDELIKSVVWLAQTGGPNALALAMQQIEEHLENIQLDVLKTLDGALVPRPNLPVHEAIKDCVRSLIERINQQREDRRAHEKKGRGQPAGVGSARPGKIITYQGGSNPSLSAGP